MLHEYIMTNRQGHTYRWWLSEWKASVYVSLGWTALKVISRG